LGAVSANAPASAHRTGLMIATERKHPLRRRVSGPKKAGNVCSATNLAREDDPIARRSFGMRKAVSILLLALTVLGLGAAAFAQEDQAPGVEPKVLAVDVPGT